MSKTSKSTEINTVLLIFNSTEDCQELKAEYSGFYEQLSNELIRELKKYESKFYERVKIEITHSIEQGKRNIDFAKTKYVLPEELFEKCKLNELFSTSNKYITVCNLLAQLQKHILDKVAKTPIDKEICEKLFEIYSYISYELSKIGYMYGLGTIKQTDKIRERCDNQNSNSVCSQKLKYCRLSHNLTQSQMGEICCCDRASISLYENSGVNIPMKILIKYSEMFNIKMDDLTDDKVSLDDFINMHSLCRIFI